MSYKPSKLEEDFLLLHDKSKETPLSIEEISLILSGKWELLIVVILSLPFCLPIQIPGFSTPFGIAIIFIGLKIAFGKYAWLPKKILAKKISSHTLQKITEKALWLLNKMQGLIHPRWNWLCSYPASNVVNGLLITLLGLLLALPLPIPLSNLFAAWSLVLIGLGLLEDDGIFVLIGYLLSFCTVIFFIAIFFLIKTNINFLHSLSK